MLKNKIAFKRIRNLIFLGLIMVIMLGIYNNSVRSSRAEGVVKISAVMEDKNQFLTSKEVTVEATNNGDGTYSVQLTNMIDGKKVSKYYTADGTEVAATTGTVLIVSESEILENKVSIDVEYDSKVVTSGQQTLAIYNQTLSSAPVTINGYVPDGVTLSTTELDINSLGDIKLPEENLRIEKAYDISIAGYQPVEYGETLKVTIGYNPTSTPIIYHVGEDGTLTAITSSVSGRRIEFTANQFSKYLVVVRTDGSEPDVETENIISNTTTNTVTNTITNTVTNEVTNTTVDNAVENEVVVDTIETEKDAPVWTKESSTITESGMDIVITGRDDNWGYDELAAEKIEVLVDGETADSITEKEIEENIAEEYAKLEEEIDKDLAKTEEEKTEAKVLAKESLRKAELKNKILVRLQNKEDIVENEITTGVRYTVSLSNMEQSARQTKEGTEEYKLYTEWSGNVSLKIAAGTLTDIVGITSVETIVEDVEKTDKQTEETADKMFRDKINPEYVCYSSFVTENEDGTKKLSVVFDINDKYFAESTLKTENITIWIEGFENANTVIEKTLTKINDVKDTVNGVEKKVGETYELNLSGFENLNSNGEQYYGPVQVLIGADVAKDTSENKSLAKTITAEFYNPEVMFGATATQDDPIAGSFASKIDASNYGEYVDYPIDLNGDGDTTNDWKLFYRETTDANLDGVNTFLIAADYVEAEQWVPSDLGFIRMGNVVGFNETSITSIDEDIRNRYILTDVLDTTSDMYSVVAGLLKTDLWNEKLLDSDYAVSTVGAPTLEMWIDSWNQKNPNNKMYFSETANGYKVGITENPTGDEITLEELTSMGLLEDALYNTDVGYSRTDWEYYARGYYFASTTTMSNSPWITSIDFIWNGLRWSYMQDINGDGTGLQRGYGLRPVVCLKADIEAEKKRRSLACWIW